MGRGYHNPIGRRDRPPDGVKKKGRSSELIHMRNIRLLKRYYELSEVKRMRIDDILQCLSVKEFFLSKTTIWAIIRGNTDMLDMLARGESIDDTPCVKDANQLDLFNE